MIYIVDEESGSEIVQMAKKLANKDGKSMSVSVIMVEVKLDQLIEKLRSTEDEQVIVVTPDNKVIYHASVQPQETLSISMTEGISEVKDVDGIVQEFVKKIKKYL